MAKKEISHVRKIPFKKRGKCLMTMEGSNSYPIGDKENLVTP
jgi:hypothetical protein